MLCHVFRHVDKQTVALLFRHFPVVKHGAKKDFDIDLMVRAVHAGRIINGIRIKTPAGQSIFNTPELRHAEVTALADDFCAYITAIDAYPVIGTIPDFPVTLMDRLDIGANATKP